jgi:hypothetical protein
MENNLWAYEISPDLGCTQFFKENHAWERAPKALIEDECHAEPVQRLLRLKTAMRAADKQITISFTFYSFLLCRGQFRVTDFGAILLIREIGPINGRHFGIDD